MDEQRVLALQSIVEANPILRAILYRWDRVALPDAWLVAGAVAQTVWNYAFDRPPMHGIDDIDLVYFDAEDLSEAAEAAHQARIRAAFPDLTVRFDVKNEARVHLWYEAKTGSPIAPYRSTPEAISTFPTTATAIGLRPHPRGHGLELCAPFGLGDLFAGIVRPNKAQITQAIYERKIARWRALWPRLTILEWNHQAAGHESALCGDQREQDSKGRLLQRRRPP